MTKKRASEIFLGKGKMFQIFHKVKKISENRGEIRNRGEMHHGLRGDGRPCKEEFCVLKSVKKRVIYVIYQISDSRDREKSEKFPFYGLTSFFSHRPYFSR